MHISTKAREQHHDPLRCAYCHDTFESENTRLSQWKLQPGALLHPDCGEISRLPVEDIGTLKTYRKSILKTEEQHSSPLERIVADTHVTPAAHITEPEDPPFKTGLSWQSRAAYKIAAYTLGLPILLTHLNPHFQEACEQSGLPIKKRISHFFQGSGPYFIAAVTTAILATTKDGIIFSFSATHLAATLAAGIAAYFAGACAHDGHKEITEVLAEERKLHVDWPHVRDYRRTDCYARWPEEVRDEYSRDVLKLSQRLHQADTYRRLLKWLGP